MRERRAHYEHIIGGTPEQRSSAPEQLKKFFEEGRQEKPFEIKKEEWEMELLQETDARVSAMVHAWGGNGESIAVESVHFFPPGYIEHHTDGDLKIGRHDILDRSVEIELSGSTLRDGHILAHELFHQKSYKSGQIHKDGTVKPYRSGLQMIDRHDTLSTKGFERNYFKDLEEAVVEESAMRLTKSRMSEPAFQEEIRYSQEFIERVLRHHHEVPDEKKDQLRTMVVCVANAQEWIERAMDKYPGDEEDQNAYLTGVLESLREQDYVLVWGREEERGRMYDLMDRIIEGSAGEYSTRDELFEIFARANYSGNYLPLARVIEKTLGEGAFRKVAEDFSTKRELSANDIKNALLKILDDK